jgi:hypothetical protein
VNATEQRIIVITALRMDKYGASLPVVLLAGIINGKTIHIRNEIKKTIAPKPAINRSLLLKSNLSSVKG